MMTMLLAAPAFASGEFSLFPAYWNPKASNAIGGGGVQFGWDFTPTFGMEVRGTYFKEMTNDPLRAAFHSDDPVFRDKGIRVRPVEAGLKLRFGENPMFRPYVGGGVSYFFLDSDLGNIKDETGWYGELGTDIGHLHNTNFFAEALWRSAEATVNIASLDRVDLADTARVNLDGFGANVGVRWHFGSDND